MYSARNSRFACCTMNIGDSLSSPARALARVCHANAYVLSCYRCLCSFIHRSTAQHSQRQCSAVRQLRAERGHALLLAIRDGDEGQRLVGTAMHLVDAEEATALQLQHLALLHVGQARLANEHRLRGAPNTSNAGRVSTRVHCTQASIRRTSADVTGLMKSSMLSSFSRLALVMRKSYSMALNFTRLGWRPNTT